MSRLNLVLLVLVVGLAVVAVWVFLGDPRVGERARIPLDFDVEEVRSLEIQNGHGTIRLERRGDQWFVVEPFQYPGDTLKVATLVANLESIRSPGPLRSGDTPPAKLREAGLDQETARFTLRGQDWQIRGVVGEPPKIGSRTFMAVDGRSGVFTFVSSQAAAFFEAPDAFRDPRALRFAPSGLNEVEWEGEHGRIHIRDGGAGWWFLVEPAEGPVHPGAFEELFTSLRRMRVLQWLASSRSRSADTGLEGARRRITVSWNDDGSQKDDTLLLGRVTGGDRVHGKHPGEDPVFLVDRSAAERILAFTVKDLRDAVVLRIREGSLDRVQLTARDGGTRAYRWGGTHWLTSDGRPAPARSVHAVSRLLAALAVERIVRFLPVTVERERPGGPAPRLTLRIDFRGRRPSAVVRFSDGAAGLMHVRRGQERVVLGVDAKVFAPLLAPFGAMDQSQEK